MRDDATNAVMEIDMSDALLILKVFDECEVTEGDAVYTELAERLREFADENTKAP